MTQEEKTLLINSFTQIMEWYEEDHENVIRTQDEYYGICQVVVDLDLSGKADDFICEYLDRSLPKTSTRYSWDTYDKQSRINWLKQQIQTLNP